MGSKHSPGRLFPLLTLVTALLSACNGGGGGGGNNATPSAPSGVPANSAPQVYFGYQTAFPGSTTLELLGYIVDPDEQSPCSACRVVSVSVTGDCKPTVVWSSTCLEGVTVDIYRTARTGTCQLTVKVQDSAGVVGTTVKTVRY